MLVGAGFGIMMLYVGITQYFLQRALVADPKRVTVTIIQSEVSKHQSSNTRREPLRDDSTISYNAEVKFSYTIDGKMYESDMIKPTIIVQGYASRSSAEDVIKPYPLGAKVEAYYGVGHPDKAYLIRETSAGPVVFIIVGLVVPVAAWAVARWLI